MSALDKVDPEWAWQPFAPTATRVWDRRMAAHLYRRAGFGASWQQLETAVKQSPTALAEQFVQGPNSGSMQGSNDELARTVLATGDPRQLAAWWTYVLIHTDHPALERMTLLWHGHFATGAEKVTDAAL